MVIMVEEMYTKEDLRVLDSKLEFIPITFDPIFKGIFERNLDILKLYKLLDGINKLDSFEIFKCNELYSRIDLLLELGYEKLLESNVGLLNADISDIKKLYILKSLGMLPSDMNEVVNILSNKEFLSYVDDSYLFNNAANISDSVFNDGLFVKNIGDNIIKYDKIWAEIK